MKERGYISIFKGSPVEADQVHEYLEQNNIGSLVRNHMQENLSAGWMMTDSGDQAEVFISEEDFSAADRLVKNMFHDGADSEEEATGSDKD